MATYWVDFHKQNQQMCLLLSEHNTSINSQPHNCHTKINLSWQRSCLYLQLQEVNIPQRKKDKCSQWQSCRPESSVVTKNFFCDINADVTEQFRHAGNKQWQHNSFLQQNLQHSWRPSSRAGPYKISTNYDRFTAGTEDCSTSFLAIDTRRPYWNNVKLLKTYASQTSKLSVNIKQQTLES